jgi:hypothetical protein
LSTLNIGKDSFQSYQNHHQAKMNQQTEYTFEDDVENTSSFKKFGNFIWNSKNKELFGRDGASWGNL